MKILGIDPGTTRVGFGLIEYERSRVQLLEYGVLEITGQTEIEKLSELARLFKALLQKTKPELASLEKLFFSKNQKTALSVSQARGVLILLLSEQKIPIVEYQPRTVKQSVTSYGLADKKAVRKMVARILNIDTVLGYDDASDALAIALTAARADLLV